jgi:hypothetical protein
VIHHLNLGQKLSKQWGKAPTSDEIRTMSVARSGWSVPKSLSGCSRTKDDIRLTRNESALKRRRLRIENIALRRKIRQLENLLETEGK